MVGNQKIVASKLERVPGDSPIYGGVHVIAGANQHFRVETEDTRIVLDHENAIRWALLAGQRHPP
jgi:hypothetical protein